jgi:hypothetical protein
MLNSFSMPPDQRSTWVSVVSGELYPDYLEEANLIYRPVLIRFEQLLDEVDTSAGLFRAIAREPGSKMVQLARVFRKYVSPATSVEMLKRRTKADEIINDFGDRFRSIAEVRERFRVRTVDDEAITALLYEYKDRGQKGYELTGLFFDWFESVFGSTFKIEEPRGAGRDVYLPRVLEDYPHNTPTDFIIRAFDNIPLVVGFARYDSDRGGAQEDDRTGGYGEKVSQILEYASSRHLNIKVLFVNDGPGLLLGSMWEDYARLDSIYGDKVMVCTLKMLDDRLTEEWIRG